MGGSTVYTSTKETSLDVTTSVFGTPIPIVYGTHKLNGNIIDYVDFTITENETTSGKGGVTTVSYTYSAAIAVGLCEGEINGIGRIWDSSTGYKKHAINSDWSLDSSTLAAINALYYDSDGNALSSESTLAVFYGSKSQSAWSYMTSKHNGKTATTTTTSARVSSPYQITLSVPSGYTFGGISAVYYYSSGDSIDITGYSFNSSTLVLTLGSAYSGKTVYVKYTYYLYSVSSDHALKYPYLCYVAGYLSLGSTNSLPEYGFEVFGKHIYGSGNLDCEPYYIVTGLLTDDVYGVSYPTAYIGDLTTWKTYCLAMGLFLSVALDSQTGISDTFNDIMTATNSQFVNSQGSLKVVPYGTSTVTGNGATYTPDLDALYSLSDQDYIYDSGEDPVKMSRDETSDIYNFQQVTFKNRSDEYADDVVSAEDLASINQVGLKKNDSTSLDCICTESVAVVAVQHILERSLYHRNQYTVKLPYFPFFLLDPMDLIEITDEVLGLESELVRVISVDIDSDKYVTIEVEEVGITGTGTVEYTRQSAIRASTNAAVSPGSVNTPVLFEPPSELGDGYEVWAAVSGASSNWGGCYVYLSSDGDTYKKVGEISSKARQGVLTAALASGDDPDTTNTLKVSLVESLGTLASGTQDDADDYNTLCYVDGELISYETAALTDTNKYTLSYLRRGVYGTTIAEHASGSDFLRIDSDRFFQYEFTEADIGKTVYLKFCSYNIFGAKVEDLADVTEYTYTITGSAMYSALDDVENLSISYSNNTAVLSWDAVTDFRSPIYYEIRKGDELGSAQVLGRVSTTSYTLQSTGTYWIAAVFQKTYNSKTYIAYSANWEEIECALATIATNEISSIDEAGTDWSGTCSGGAEIKDNILCLGSAELVDDITVNVDTLDDWDEYGGISTSGMYTIPTDHIFHVDEDQAVTLTASYDVSVVLVNGKFDDITNVDALTYWDNEDPNYGSATVQINVALSDGSYTGWQNFTPGQYYGSYFNFRIVLATTSNEYNVYVSSFVVSATVDTRYESGNVTVPTSGITVSYAKKFNNIPKPSITIFDAEEGDTYKLTSQTSSGFTVAITNSGTAVSRSINWTSIGY